MAEDRYIYKSQIKEEFYDIANKFVRFNKEVFKLHPKWFCLVKTSLQQLPNILIIPEFLDLKLELLRHCDLFMRKNDLEFSDGYIEECWINIYEKNYYQEFHDHARTNFKYFSGVLYLTDDNSKIQFFRDNSIFLKPKKGEIIIFDSSYEHRVLPQDSNSLRVSLAFNFKKCRDYSIKANDSR